MTAKEHLMRTSVGLGFLICCCAGLAACTAAALKIGRAHV